MSFFVIALHLAYVMVLLGDFFSNDSKMWLALCAYSLYLINAIQFLLKLRAARLLQASMKEHESEVIA